MESSHGTWNGSVAHLLDFHPFLFHNDFSPHDEQIEQFEFYLSVFLVQASESTVYMIVPPALPPELNPSSRMASLDARRVQTAERAACSINGAEDDWINSGRKCLWQFFSQS